MRERSSKQILTSACKNFKTKWRRILPVNASKSIGRLGYLFTLTLHGALQELSRNGWLRECYLQESLRCRGGSNAMRGWESICRPRYPWLLDYLPQWTSIIACISCFTCVIAIPCNWIERESRGGQNEPHSHTALRCIGDMHVYLAPRKVFWDVEIAF